MPRIDNNAAGLVSLGLVPFRLAKFRLNRASSEDAAWLAATLERKSSPFGTHVAHGRDDRLTVLR
jgi:hypothetical protein